MELVIIGLIMAGVILTANLLALRNNKGEEAVFRWLLFAANLPLLLVGVAFLTTPADLLQELMRDSNPAILTGEGIKAMGPAIVFMAVWGMAATLMLVQRPLSRLIPIKPGSSVHTLALVLAGYLLGYTALALSQGGVEGLAETAQSTPIALFVIQELFFAVVGILGAGWLIRRNGRALLERLGLVRPTLSQLRRGIVWIIVLVILEIAAGALWQLLNPEQVANLEDVNNVLMGNFDTIGEWLVLALAAGIGEEILFRGAIQPVLGLWFTSILFAIIHIQYGFSPATLIIVILALILGTIRRRTNTTVAIFVHAGYNFLLGLIVLLGMYAEQLAP